MPDVLGAQSGTRVGTEVTCFSDFVHCYAEQCWGFDKCFKLELFGTGML